LEFTTPKGKEEEAYVPAKLASQKPQWTPRPQVEEGLVEPERPARQQTTSVAVPKTASRSAAKGVKEGTKSVKVATPSPTPTPTIPKVVLPERKKPPPAADSYPGETYETDVDDIHPVPPPGRQELLDLPAASSTIHWQKQVEHFPVPTGEIIKLPTGTPVAIPKIQYAFEDETSDAKRTREKRQVRVKEEFKKAWEGYKTYAWLHDELSPVSGKFRDPFCGWAGK
jgi:mannosyl-oligosaccharide alpha-1,2-mannosidase